MEYVSPHLAEQHTPPPPRIYRLKIRSARPLFYSQDPTLASPRRGSRRKKRGGERRRRPGRESIALGKQTCEEGTSLRGIYIYIYHGLCLDITRI
ncbi:hypothetical protein FKM82_012837 [Ascaphus truei]